MAKSKKGKPVSEAEKMRRAMQAATKKTGKQDNGFEDCHRLYRECVDLLQLPALLHPVISQPGVDENIDPAKRPGMDDNIALMTKDTRALSEKLQAVYALHADKHGSPRTPDELVLSIQIVESYMQFMEAHRTTVRPVFHEVMEVIAEAERKVAQQQAAHAGPAPHGAAEVEARAATVESSADESSTAAEPKDTTQ